MKRVVAFGYNGFDQIVHEAYDKALAIEAVNVTTIEGNGNKLTPSWSSCCWIKDKTIHVKGYIGGESSCKKVLNMSKVIHNSTIADLCCHNNWMIVLMDSGKLSCINKVSELDTLIEVSEEMISIVKHGVVALASNNQINKICIVKENSKLSFYLVHSDTLALEKEMTCNLTVKSVGLGNSHSLILTKDGRVYTWGLGSRGQLGHGDLLTQEEPKLVEILSMVFITSVATGGWHNLALSDSGDVYSWGWNESGQAGFPYPGGVFDAKEEDEKEEEETSIVCEPRLLELEKCCGVSGGDAFVTVTSVSCGSRHSCAVTSDGKLVTWGWDGWGQLGSGGGGGCHGDAGDGNDGGAPRVVGCLGGAKVVDVKCGWWNTFAVCESEK